MKINQIMKQAQEMQKKMQEHQDSLASQEFEAASGGGMVTAKVNGKGELLAIKLEPDVVSKDDIEMLQDLIVAAINEANTRVAEAQQAGMASMMGGMKIPGLF